MWIVRERKQYDSKADQNSNINLIVRVSYLESIGKKKQNYQL